MKMNDDRYVLGNIFMKCFSPRNYVIIFSEERLRKMKRRWVLKQDLKCLRDKMGLSMAALAELSFTTNTTIFRIEKTKIVSDESLAQKLSEVLNIPFEELYLEKRHEDEALAEWDKHLKAVYQEQPDMNRTYYLVFVTRYDGGKKYQAISPTYWLSATGGTSERRKLLEYYPDAVMEHLGEFNVRCAVVHSEMNLIYFYYGLEDEKWTAMLICTDTAREVYPQLKTEYFVERKDMFDFCGFKDCVSVQLHTFSDEIR